MSTPEAASASTTWVIVASLDHARRGVEAGFIMANHGKRAPLARMRVDDRILIYSPKTSLHDGRPLKAIAIVGRVIGAQPQASDVIPGGFRRRAELREIDPVPLASLREHLPMAALRFGFFGLEPSSADAIWAIVAAESPYDAHH